MKHHDLIKKAEKLKHEHEKIINQIDLTVKKIEKDAKLIMGCKSTQYSIRERTFNSRLELSFWSDAPNKVSINARHFNDFHDISISMGDARKLRNWLNRFLGV